MYPSTTSNLVIQGKTTLSTVIAKISKRQTNQMRRSWRNHRETLSSVIKAKKSIARGVIQPGDKATFECPQALADITKLSSTPPWLGTTSHGPYQFR
jgi:hypothetical protein